MVLDWVLDGAPDRVLDGVVDGVLEGAIDRTFDGCQRPNSGTEPHTAMHSPHTVGCADVSTSNVNCSRSRD